MPLSDNIAELLNARLFDKAVADLRKLEGQRPLTIPELVAKSRALQLAEGEDSENEAEDGLKAAERALVTALALDEDSVEALVDLGYFYYAVENDASRAKPLFERALSICRTGIIESASGVAGCLSELSSPLEAREFLLGLRQDLIHEIDAKFEPLLDEYEASMEDDS